MTVTTDLSVIRDNLYKIRERVKDRTLTLMVKADAYNHGAERVAAVSEPLADRFGVAAPSEGAALRRSGIAKPIDVFSPLPSQICGIVECNMTPVIHSFETLGALSACRGAEVEVKFDTGMHRMGFKTPAEVETAARMLNAYGVRVRALITHFASRETEKEQLARFKFMKETFEHAYGSECRGEAAASDGMKDGFLLDGVRVGRLLYDGAMTVTSEVLAVSRVCAGDRIGYGGLFAAERDTFAAVVSGGYADGVRRDYCGAEIEANGSGMNIAAVCMDVSVAVNASERIKAGDKVKVFGLFNRESFLKVSRANIYEIYTSFKGRTERKYIPDGKIPDTSSDAFRAGEAI